jgi:hypothetical protein
VGLGTRGCAPSRPAKRQPRRHPLVRPNPVLQAEFRYEG